MYLTPERSRDGLILRDGVDLVLDMIHLHCVQVPSPDDPYYENSTQHRQKQPDDDDDRGGSPVYGFALSHNFLGSFPALSHNRRRNHPQREGDAQGDQDKVIQVTQDGNKVWNQV